MAQLFIVMGLTHMMGRLKILKFLMSTALALVFIDCEIMALRAEDASFDENRYRAMVDDYRALDDQHQALELIASGSAATLVGLYGYNFDNRGVLAGIAYAGTQTAGILVIGEGIRRYYSTSLVTAMDQAINGADASKNGLKRALLKHNDQMAAAKLRSDAWVAGLLGGIYMYNAARTPKSLASGRNVFLFLSINALAVSGYSTYKLHHASDRHEVGVSMTITGPRFYAMF